MISSQPIVDQLRGAGYSHAEGLLEFGQLKSAPRNLPAAFVIPERTAPEGAPRVGAYDQKVTLIFSVALVLKFPTRHPARVNEDLRDEIKRVQDCLFGWQHPEAASGCVLAGGRLLDLDASTVTWLESFSTTYRKRKVQ